MNTAIICSRGGKAHRSHIMTNVHDRNGPFNVDNVSPPRARNSGLPESTAQIVEEEYMLRTRIAFIAVVVLVGSLLVPGQAMATTYPETRLPDNGNHDYCFTSGFANSRDPYTAHYAMRTLDSTTDMTSTYVGACNNNNTDIWWFALDLAGTVRGEWQCIFTSSTRCNSADVRIDFDQIDIGDNDIADRDKTSVHEVGHSVGFGHHSPAAHDCALVSGELPSLDIKWRRYHAHDIAHINATF